MMKKTAIIFAAIGAVLFLLGVQFKFLHWQGASLMITLGLAVNCLIVMPILAIFSRSMKSPSKNLYLFGALSTFVWLAGWLFKIQHWPAQAILVTIGTVSLIVFIILVAVKLHKE